ncbi:MAG TPA: elongation factor P [Candidatus Omnitrophota bacterium]|jgi:elongation factor P|nr:elongation factor P [Candidatus Omnitrophota bacterium]HPN55927.1 elongation factor P [Candidatus Omnitrophota bacterium]
MTVTINQLNIGMGLLVDNDICMVNELHHVKPGKGSAFVRVKMRNLKTGNVIERTYKTADKLEDITLEEKELEYLYHSGDHFCFMDHTTYEQVSMTDEEVGEAEKFLLESLIVAGLSYNDKIVKINLPNFVIAKITETEPGIKGDSSRSGTKPAKIETGTVVQVPLFINVDDWVKIDTRTGVYVERVKNES